MVLVNGIYPDNERMFGVLKFIGLRRAVAKVENGVETNEIDRRVYDLRCAAQGMVIQVSVPGDVPECKFGMLEGVTLVDPEVSAIPSANTFGNAKPEWYVTAKNIVAATTSAAKPSGTPAVGNGNNPAAANGQQRQNNPAANGQERH